MLNPAYAARTPRTMVAAPGNKPTAPIHILKTLLARIAIPKIISTILGEFGNNY